MLDRTTQRFMQRTFEPDDRIALVLINGRTTHQRIFRARHFGGHMGDLEKANAGGWNIYVAVNPLTEEATGRTKSDIGRVRHVFADFDADAEKRIAAMNKSARMPRPNEIVTTSPGKAQVLWRVEGFSQERAEALMRGLVREFRADPAATDVARVMRVPGFRNAKYNPAPYVGIRQVHGGVASPDQFPEYSQEQQRGGGLGYERERGKQDGISPSERDWAYVRDALRRNVDPSELRARLAEMRTDKPHPEYYAELTVGRALEALQRDRGGRSR